MNREFFSLTNLKFIMNEIQTCDADKFAKNVKEVIKNIEKDNSFLQIINTILVYQNNTIPSKIVLFLKKIFEELFEHKQEILNAIILYIADKLNCKIAKIRIHSLSLINMILKHYKTPNQTIFDIIQLVNEKLFDKDTSVRKEAMKICINYQNLLLHENLSVQTTLKDAIRFDSASEIRKIGLLGLEINESTLNCILEKAMDINLSVRNVFWSFIFPKINLFELETCKIIYLLKLAFTEREINLKTLFLNRFVDYGFLNAIDLIYTEDTVLIDKIINFYIISDGRYDLRAMFLDNKNFPFNDNYFNTTFDYLLNFKPSFLHFLNLFFVLTEENKGRDNLCLIPIECFLLTLYKKCEELEEVLINDEQEFNNCKKSIQKLFKLLIFYDIFTESDKKMILSLISNLILKSHVVEVVEECIILSKRVCDNNLVNFLGSIIKKTKNTPICFLVCEFIFKYFPENNFYNIGEMKNAIISEIAMLNLSQCANLFYWYLVSNNENKNIEQLYLGFLPNFKILQGVVDLIILGSIKEHTIVEEIFKTQINLFYSDVSNSTTVENIIPLICKLMLAKKINEIEYIKFMLVDFYITKAENIQQYLSLFFFEFFRLNPEFLIDSFCQVLGLIEINQKTFIDQSIYWLQLQSEINMKNNLQDLFFKITLFYLNNYDNLNNKKYYYQTLELIQKYSNINSNIFINSLNNKKIIYLLSCIIKKKPKENFNLILTKIMEIDDGSPMEGGVFEELKLLIN